MLADHRGREISYLRLSVTSECDLNCFYCRADGNGFTAPDEPQLSDDEIVRLCGLLVREGVRKIRITGGEPLMRPGVAKLIGRIAEVSRPEEISLTTNGVLLSRCAADLASAGLKRVNVSLDSLVEERFGRITGGASPKTVLDGIAEAQRQGLEPVKINVVVMRGINDDEVVDFARLTAHRRLQVRFIELMPIGLARDVWADLFVGNAEVRRRIDNAAGLLPFEDGLSRYGARYRLPGAAGEVAFISPMTEPFCDSCDRIRITASGDLRPCLRSEFVLPLAGMLRSAASDEELILAIRQVVLLKGFPSEEDAFLPAMFCTGG